VADIKRAERVPNPAPSCCPSVLGKVLNTKLFTEAPDSRCNAHRHSREGKGVFMAVWKILVIGLLSCACLALTMATIAIPISQDGSQRWAWLAGLLSATLVVATLLVIFLRYADGSLDIKPRGNRS